MAWDTPGHRRDADGHYCESDCPQCAKEKAAGENKCAYCKTARGSGQYHADYSCFEAVKALSDEERHCRYVNYKRGWVVGASFRAELGTNQPEYLDEYNYGKEMGKAAFKTAMESFFRKLGGETGSATKVADVVPDVKPNQPLKGPKMGQLTEIERCAALSKKFLKEMKDRGITDIEDIGLRYHLALLLRPEGHPTIKLEEEPG